MFWHQPVDEISWRKNVCLDLRALDVDIDVKIDESKWIFWRQLILSTGSVIDVDVDVKRNVDESNHSLVLFFFQGPFSALNFCDVSSSQIQQESFPFIFCPSKPEDNNTLFYYWSNNNQQSIIFTQDFSKDTYEWREGKNKNNPLEANKESPTRPRKQLPWQLDP